MSHNYYRNPKGRMVKMGIMFGSLCFSAYMLPKTLDKLSGSGLGSALQPGGGISPEAQRILGQGGIESLLNAEKNSIKQPNGGGSMVIMPSGVMSGEEYDRLRKQAERMAPIRVVRGKPEAVSEGQTGQAVAQEGTPSVEDLLELLEQQKDGG